jgi:hypothetical protein
MKTEIGDRFDEEIGRLSTVQVLNNTEIITILLIY